MLFERQFTIMGSHIDFNHHVGNLAYFDFFNTAFFSFLKEKGIYDIMHAANLTTVVFKETNCYLKEILPDKWVTVKVQLTELSETGHKFSAYGELFRSDGVKAALHERDVGVMHRIERRIHPLPEQALAILRGY